MLALTSAQPLPPSSAMPRSGVSVSFETDVPAVPAVPPLSADAPFVMPPPSADSLKPCAPSPTVHPATVQQSPAAVSTVATPLHPFNIILRTR